MEAATEARVKRQLWFFDQLVIVRIAHDDGRDGITMFESGGPYGTSPPLHVHRTEDEAFYVLEGELRILAGEADLRIGPGEAALAPIGVPHTYRVESRTGARWLNVTTHGDFERFARALSRPAERNQLPPPQGPPTPEQLEALVAAGRRFGIEVVGPPLESLPHDGLLRRHAGAPSADAPFRCRSPPVD
jgi:quercetin dioxygenase-like cupin family protein